MTLKTQKEKLKEEIWEDKLYNRMLLRKGRHFVISGAGKLLLWDKYIYGNNWKKFIKRLRKRGNDKAIEEIKIFKEQERKYGINVKLLNPKANFDNMEFKAIRRK